MMAGFCIGLWLLAGAFGYVLVRRLKVHDTGRWTRSDRIRGMLFAVLLGPIFAACGLLLSLDTDEEARW